MATEKKDDPQPWRPGVAPKNDSYPFAQSKVTIYMARQIEALKSVKTQREIAAEVGYEKPNMISMLKRGEVRVPLDKIPLLAKALHVDPRHLFRLALEDYWPDRQAAFSEIFGTIVSQNEVEILAEIRKVTGDKDIQLTPELKKHLRDAFKK